MKKVLFVILFVLFLFSECLPKKYSKKNKTKQLKNPPPYVNKYSNEIAVYVNRESHPVVNAILYHISVRTCLNFNLVHKKIKYKSGINIYETLKHNSLKMSSSKRKPTILKLQKYVLTNRARLAVYIGRALGMIPEISRSDRDEFVQIHWRNIKKSHRHYYRKTKNNYSYYPGVEFDFGSIMLVNPLFGSKNKRKPTYTFKINSGFNKIYDPFHVLSHNDFKFINGMYCRKKCKKNYCKNGGFPGKNCKCI
uniref:Metalloendopeptidase n=1 Tax=Strongyloides papillosus TaxID=174720 RepID=A0A0N5CH96_STREA